MPTSSSFSVKPQPAQENQNPNGYSTQPAFFMPGSRAADAQSRRKKKALSPLVPLLDSNHMGQSSSRLRERNNYGLMTPETPSINFLETNSNYQQQAGFFPMYPMAFGQGMDLNPPNTQNYDMSTGANILFSAANPPYQIPVQFPDSFRAQPNVWEDHMDWDSQLPAADYMDLDGMDTIRPDLSPLTQHHHGALPPDFDQNSTAAGLHSTDSKPQGRKKYTPRSTTIDLVSKMLQEAQLTPTTMLINLLETAAEDSDGSSTHALPGKAFFRSTNAGNIRRLLDLIMANEKGSAIIKDWMMPHAVDLICEKIHDEMESAKPHLSMAMAEATPSFIESWDINEIMEPVSKDITPTWSAILSAAIQSKSSAKNSKKSLKCRQTTQNIISAQVHYQRSFNSAKVQIGLGLMAWSTGASRNLINVLHKAGLSTSYCSITNIISSLNKFSIEQAKKVSQGPHAFCYDNVNLSTSIFVEQRPGAMSKVQSGTFPVIYRLEDVNLEHMKLAPMIENLKNSKPLRLCDIRPMEASASSYAFQTTVNVAKILFKHTDGFDALSEDSLIQHKPRRPLPNSRKTHFYPISVSTIEEASVTGNLHVHDNVYVEQLGHIPEDLNEYAIPSINDQLTNARIRGCQTLRAKDVNSYERRELFLLGFGVFHLVMNFIWVLLHTYRGTIAEHGSLAHYFSLLEKTRLGNDRPDYHTLLAALTQILEGLILNAWYSECGYPTLEAFAASNPTPDDILRIAQGIVHKYATPPKDSPRTEAPSKRKAGESDKCDEGPPVLQPDHVHSNTVLLTRDLLLVIELINAISTGDFGRIEDVLPQLACMFRGAGSNNYSMEILHFLFNIKQVWTPEFANIMRDIMLVNPSGLPGHFMAIDMNIEHLIGYLKALFSAKGLYSNWDRLGNISAAINYLQLIKKRVALSLDSGYQGSTHKTPDTSALVRRIANRARELKLQQYVKGRVAQSEPVTDLHRAGYRKFESASLAVFNKKIHEYKTGRSFEASEADEIPAVNFSDTAENPEHEQALFDETEVLE